MRKSAKNFNGVFFNIAHGERTSLLEVKKLIEKYTNRKILLESRPTRAGDVRYTHADISKAKKQFGYRLAVSFEKGLKRTVTWFETRKN